MNEIQAYDKINDRDGLEMLGAAIQRSGMFGAETKEQGIILALQCMVEKKPPLEMAKNSRSRKFVFLQASLFCQVDH